MGKTSFSKVVLCHTGDFGERNEKIRKWVEYHGGKVEHRLSPETTHLVASEKAWKKGHDLVRKATKQSSVDIVTFDWLEDSLHTKSATPKSVRKYLWSKIDKAGEQRTLAQAFAKAEKVKKRLSQFDKDCEQLARDLGQEGYHLYTDATSFTYSITLARTNILNNKIERHHVKVRQCFLSSNPIPTPAYYLNPSQIHPIVFLPLLSPIPYPSRVPQVRPLAQQIQIVESDALPPTYGLLIQYHKYGSKPGTDLLCPLGSNFDIVFKQFRWFFKKKTGIEWEKRAENLRGPEMGEDGKDTFEVDGETGVRISGWFRYMPPKGKGEGKGLVLAKTTAEECKEKLEEIMVVLPTDA
ncbi:putative brct domain-containing protein [Phaeomoniella chlamydospora]|uniref:Putative brct domain-containing protein n=1 Tax=Phaeomoniella chlamydospora TaxID=158046 RepID=A0A0G2EPU0_PHACM|nr:putative brct domain-containing protein [Phaeomoniella chlamydospora]